MRAIIASILTLGLAPLAVHAAERPGMDQSAIHAQNALARGMACSTHAGAVPRMICIGERRSLMIDGATTLKGVGINALPRHSSQVEGTIAVLAEGLAYLLPGWAGGSSWVGKAVRSAKDRGTVTTAQHGPFTVRLAPVETDSGARAYAMTIERRQTP